MEKTIDTKHLESLLERVTPGEWSVVEDPFTEQNYKTCVEAVYGSDQTQIASAEHNWNEAGWSERRISWKEAQDNAELMAMSKTLARRVIAAEKLAEGLREISEMSPGLYRGSYTEIIDEQKRRAVTALNEWDKSQ